MISPPRRVEPKTADPWSVLRGALLVAVGVLLASGWASCASRPSPSPSRGDPVHVVREGENLYRIGLRYGVSADAIKRANRIGDVTELSVGTRLKIPGARIKPGTSPAVVGHPSDIASAQKLSRQEAMRRAKLDFEWPLHGRLTSRFGPRNGRRHEGIDVAARRGTDIHAAEAGQVIHSGRLGDYGKVVIVRHAGNYRSVYAHANTTNVRKGQSVRKGQKVAEVGTTGRSTGPHLHFEIREDRTPQDPMLYLP